MTEIAAPVTANQSPGSSSSAMSSSSHRLLLAGQDVKGPEAAHIAWMRFSIYSLILTMKILKIQIRTLNWCKDVNIAGNR